MGNEEQPKKSIQPAANNTPVIIAKPGGEQPGTKLHMFEEYQGEKKRELKKD